MKWLSQPELCGLRACNCYTSQWSVEWICWTMISMRIFQLMSNLTSETNCWSDEWMTDSGRVATTHGSEIGVTEVPSAKAHVVEANQWSGTLVRLIPSFIYLAVLSCTSRTKCYSVASFRFDRKAYRMNLSSSQTPAKNISEFHHPLRCKTVVILDRGIGVLLRWVSCCVPILWPVCPAQVVDFFNWAIFHAQKYNVLPMTSWSPFFTVLVNECTNKRLLVRNRGENHLWTRARAKHLLGGSCRGRWVSKRTNPKIDKLFCSSRFNRLNLATVQKSYAQENGEHIPAKIGLSLDIKLFGSLKDCVTTGTMFQEAAKLWTAKTNESCKEGFEHAAAKIWIELAAILKVKHGST